MIWIIIILAIIIISFILALRSMKNYQEVPTTKFPYGVFLIRNENFVLQNGTLNELYKFCLEANAIISIERLWKGSQKALVLYAPQNIGQFLPELELLEIEDYIEKEAKDNQKKASVDEVIVWNYHPKNEQELTIPETFLKDLQFNQDQNVFWQIVLNATKKENHFQLNCRVMVVEPDVHKRIELAKRIDQYIFNTLGLKKKETKDSISVLFDNYKKRVLVPVEVEGFVLSTQTIKKLF
jgi:hypothetical protein